MNKTVLYMLLIVLFLPVLACTESATKLNQQAQVALDTQKADNAIKLLKEAITLEPNNARTHYLLGMGYIAKGDLDDAISVCKKALDLNPNDIVILSLLGDIYITKGMIEESIIVSKKAITSDPEAHVAHYNLGVAYKKQGKNTIAARYFFEAGLLSLLKNSRDLAEKSYRALEEIGPAQTTQELYELLEPILTSDSKPGNPSP